MTYGLRERGSAELDCERAGRGQEAYGAAREHLTRQCVARGGLNMSCRSNGDADESLCPASLIIVLCTATSYGQCPAAHNPRTAATTTDHFAHLNSWLFRIGQARAEYTLAPAHTLCGHTLAAQ